MKKRISTVAGLHTASNVIDSPVGSFLALDNCVVRTQGVIESRRGQDFLPYTQSVVGGFTPRAPIIDAFTVAQFNFDEASGAAIDAVSGVYTMPVFGVNPPAATGLINGARSFAGVGSGQTFLLQNAALATLRDTFGLGSWTIEGWWNRNGTTHSGNLFTILFPGYGAIGTYADTATGGFGIYGLGTALISTGIANLQSSGWDHVLVRYHAGSRVGQVLINGIIAVTETSVPPPPGANALAPTVNIAFGRYADTINADLCSGLADGWRISKKFRTDDEVAETIARGLAVLGTAPTKAMSHYQGSVIAHSARLLLRDSGASLTAYNGDFDAPAESELRMKFARAQQRLYFTTATGIQRLDSLSSQPASAGVPTPQIDVNSTHLVADAGGYLSEDMSVAYRPTLTHRDPNRREMESAPGARLVVRSQKDLSSAIGGVVLAANVLTVTFDNPHNLKPGDVIDYSGGGLVGFPFPLSITVATVPSSYAVTGPLVAANGTSAATSDWDVAGNAAVSRRRVDLKLLLPGEAVTGDILRLYRTEQTAYDVTTTPHSPVEPGDECFLCYEKTLTATDISNHYVNFSDFTPDAMLGDAAYFSPSQDTVSASNDRPPLARDIATFDSCLWFGNVIQRQQIDFTVLATGGGQGIALGDTLTISIGAKSITLTASISANISAGDGHYLVALGGNVSGDNEKTALSMIASINAHASNDFIDAFYLSDPTTNPGSILLQERGVGATSPISLVVSAHGSGFTPQLPTTGGKTSKSSAFPNRVYRAKPEQPDAVPILKGYEVVGEVDDAVLRIVPSAGILWVFKERSTWHISPAGDGTYTVTEFSPDLRLIGNDTPAVLGHSLCCLTNLGPVVVAAAGVTPLGLPIDDQIVALLGYDSANFPMLPTLRRYAFGVSYATERAWILALPSSPTDTYANLVFVWNAGTGVWSKWTMSRSCAVVEPVTDLLYMGAAGTSAPTIYKERKQYRREDFKDELLESIVIDNVVTNADGTVTFHFAGATYPPVGALLEQVGIYSPNRLKGVVKSVDTGTGHFTIYPTPLLVEDEWFNGAAKVYKPIAISIRWLDQACDAPGMLKALQGVNLHFQQGAFYSASLRLSTELASERELKPLAGPDGYNVTTYAGGGTPYDHFAPPEPETAVAGYYRFGLDLTESEFYFKLAGLAVDFAVTTERTGRR